MYRFGFVLSTFAFFVLEASSFAVVSKRQMGSKQDFVSIVEFANSNFNRTLPEDWKAKFHNVSSDGDEGWKVYSGKVDGYKNVAIGVCGDKVVQLIAMAGPIGFSGGLEGMINGLLSKPAKAHWLSEIAVGPLKVVIGLRVYLVLV